MAWIGNAFFKLLQTLIYGVLFCCSAIILGAYSYFLAVLANNDLPIADWKKAVEGMSGAAALYLVFAILLTCFLGGIRFFAFLGIVLDVLFTGAFIGIAVLTRDGTDTCSGIVNTPLGNGPANRNLVGADQNGFDGLDDDDDVNDYSPDLGLACRLNKSAFAVAIIGAVLFLCAAGLQLGIARKHQLDKRFGPSPENGYSVSGKRHFWQRKPATAARDAEAGKVSHETGYTGSTVAPTAAYDSAGRPVSTGYHTAPTGTYSTNY